MGLSALPGSRALQVKSQASLFHGQNQLLIKQIQLSLYTAIYRMKYLEGNGNREALMCELWDWIQRSKARAITDLLGLNSSIPKALEQRLSTSTESQSIFERWTRLRQGLSERRRSNESTLEIENEIRDLEDQGMGSPELTEIFSLARGRAVGLKDMDQLLDAMPPEQRSKLALIDWFVGEDSDTFEMIVYKHRTVPKLFKLEPGLKEKVKEWVDTFPGAEDQRSVDWTAAWTEAQKLRVLIWPIEQMTESDDTLVLCPTGILHRFPLHALQLSRREGRRNNNENGQRQDKEVTLLERNPLVFVPSMSLFRLSCFARMGSSSLQRTYKAVIAAPIQGTMASTTDDLSDHLNCIEQNHLQGADVTKENLLSRLKAADFFHFFGHVHNRDAAHPMNAHLLLATQSHKPQDDEICTGTHEEDAWLSASKILAQKLFREGAHANLIACDSGVNYSALGDDMLGLIPALLMAGARSICSTLWAVDEKVADEWIAQLLFAWTMARDRREKAQPDSLSMINLAQCARTASLSLMGGDAGRALRMRSWAPYVFHGFWDIWDGAC